ncbi:MAG: hypothetical protein IKF83_02160 [Clostridia bacterium]|nr:hypothetical protein [Clostridia bacterium]
MNNRFITWILSILIIGSFGCIIAFCIDVIKTGGIFVAENDLQTVGNAVEIEEKKEDLSTPQIVERPIDDVETIVSSNIDYKSSKSRTNYFYNQLEEYSKKIYDGLSSNIDNMKSGTNTIEFGSAFSGVLSKEDGQTELGNYYQSAIEAFTYDNPQVFFLDPKKMYLNIQTTTKGKNKTYNVFITNGDNENYLAEGFNSAEQINSIQENIEQEKNNILSNVSGNTENKIKQIHDYLVDNLSYEQTISKPNIHNLYGAIINKECVCEGYAKAFKYLLDGVGIDNVIVIGTGTNSKGEAENHAWNYVAIDGNWYAVDVTWDDPIIQGWGISIPSMYKYKYFLKGLDTMNKDHIPNGQFTEKGKVFTYPNVSNTDY